MHVAPPLRLAAAAGFLVMVAALFVGGSQPGAGGLFEPPWDKLVHFAYFAALATLAMAATDLRRPGLVFIAVVIVGVADELAQTQLPGRHADLPDLATDVIGALVAVAVLARVRRLSDGARRPWRSWLRPRGTASRSPARGSPPPPSP